MEAHAAGALRGSFSLASPGRRCQGREGELDGALAGYGDLYPQGERLRRGGKLVATDTRRYDSAGGDDHRAGGIYLDLHQPRRQRTVQREGRLTHAFSQFVGRYSWRQGIHARPCRRLPGAVNAAAIGRTSTRCRCRMRALSWRAHIHATSSSLCSLLGRPASHSATA